MKELTREQILKQVELEKQKKIDIDIMWSNIKCPICGNDHLKINGVYSLLDINELVNMFKGRYLSGVDYKVRPYECKECGYVALRKTK